MSNYGHNSSHFGETLDAGELIGTVLGDDHKALFHYANWHIKDYLGGTKGMLPEHEGIYIRFLMNLYDRGKPFPDNDDFMSRILSLSVRVWKRVKACLVEFGKIIVKNGALTNSRFEKERQKRAEQIRRSADGARLRWAKEREDLTKSKPAETGVCSKFAPSLAETSSKLDQNVAEKPNKNNESSIKPHMQPYTQYPIKEGSKEESEEGKASLQPQRGRSRDDYDRLRAKLLLAGGEALSAIGAGLLVLSEPIRWLDNGCDLEADILPAIRKCVAGKPKNHVQGWWFFTKAVQEARDRRLAPMDAPTPRQPVFGAAPNWRDEQRANSERHRRAMDAVFGNRS